MSVVTSYPGIYIQELSSSANAIVPAPTSIAAFVGYSHPFQTTAFNVAQRCFSFSDYQTYFGPLFSSGLVDASLPRAVYQFFLNGGSVAWVVGLQPGLFDSEGDIVTTDAGAWRLGAPNGGQTITATIATTSAAGGGNSAAALFTITAANPLPTIGGIQPSSMTAGDPGFTLIVTGTGFVAGSVVQWIAGAVTTPLTTAFVDASTLTATVPATALVAGTATIKVGSPTPGGGVSAGSQTFTINSENQTPTVGTITPMTATVGQPFTLTVHGSNFVPASTVQWTDGVESAALTTTYVSDQELTADVPASALAAAGTASIAVQTPGPSGELTSPGAPPSVTITAGFPSPVLTAASLAPAAITAGNAGFTLSVTGTGFFPASVVNWAGAPLATSFVSASELTAAVPAPNVATAGSFAITVSNPAPGGGPSALAPAFTVNAASPVPQIVAASALTPATATAGSTTLTLLVRGTGFVPTSTILWGGTPLSTTYVSDTALSAIVPTASLATATTVNVSVSTPSLSGIVFTAMELTDTVPMTVTVFNLRNGNATFDLAVAHGTSTETYRGIRLTGTAAQSPAGMINTASRLIQAAPAAGGYGTAITQQQIALALALPPNAVTSFSAADFIDGDESAIAVFEPNSSLDNVEIFNLLLVPGITDFGIVSAALAFAERKRAFMIVDPPPQSPAFGSATATPQPILYWMQGLQGTGFELPVSQNGALYFPYLVWNDPLTGNNIPLAPGGFVAGIYAQTDASRGVWKAPAGLATNVLDTAGPVLSGAMNDPQQGVLNLESINCLRSFAGSGTVVWGARTLVAANPAYQQWMYVPVRRMTLFIEQTLLANLRWVVFEPNDTPLWIAITASINAFMLSLFRQGALQGNTPAQAFLVKCDSTTTTPADQAQGIVNILVMFAPLKPAEFVVVQIAQPAGQTAAS